MALPKVFYVGCLILLLVVVVEAATPPGIAKNPARASCKKKEYKMCYNLEHVCPKFCPDSCTVECASCKPICGPGSSPPPQDGSSPPYDSGAPVKDDSPPPPKDDSSPPYDSGAPVKDDSPPSSSEDGKKGSDDDDKKGGDDDKEGKKEDGGEKGGKKDDDGEKGDDKKDDDDKKGDDKKDDDDKKGDDKKDDDDKKGGKKVDDGDDDDDDDDDSGSPSKSPPYYPPSPKPSPPTPSTPPPSTQKPSPPTPSTPPPSSPKPSPPTPSTPPPSSPKPSPPTPSTPPPSSPKPSPSSPPPSSPKPPSPSSPPPSSPYARPPSPTPPSPSPPTTTPSTPASPPPGSSGVAARKKCRCKNKNYGQCYNQEHLCPASCPTSCQVDCASCKPVCNCDYPGAVCQDPRFIGGDGITFYFHGMKDRDFCLVTDPNLHINAHFIGKRNINMGRDFTWVQSIGLLFDNHRLFLGARKTSTWDDTKDRLSLAFDGEPIYLDETTGSKWMSTSKPQVTITRTSETNNVIIEIQGKLKITTKVLPITLEESRVHNYGITKEDCFAHLDLGFKFDTLSERVDGVLGKTYRDDYVSRVKMGVANAIMGGEREYATSSIFATDCLASRFNGVQEETSLVSLDLASINCASGMNGEGVVCKR